MPAIARYPSPIGQANRGLAQLHPLLLIERFNKQLVLPGGGLGTIKRHQEAMITCDLPVQIGCGTGKLCAVQ